MSKIIINNNQQHLNRNLVSARRAGLDKLIKPRVQLQAFVVGHDGVHYRGHWRHHGSAGGGAGPSILSQRRWSHSNIRVRKRRSERQWPRYVVDVGAVIAIGVAVCLRARKLNQKPGGAILRRQYHWYGRTVMLFVYLNSCFHYFFFHIFSDQSIPSLPRGAAFGILLPQAAPPATP